MKRSVATIGLALFITLGAWAQTDPPTGSSQDRSSCIMADVNTWTGVGLSSEQMLAIKDLQTSCKTAVVAAKPEAVRDSYAKHEDKLKGILTGEQYAKWIQWCAQKQTSAGAL